MGEFMLFILYLNKTVKKNAWVVILMSHKQISVQRTLPGVFERLFSNKRESIHQEDIIILNIYILNNRASNNMKQNW